MITRRFPETDIPKILDIFVVPRGRSYAYLLTTDDGRLLTLRVSVRVYRWVALRRSRAEHNRGNVYPTFHSRRELALRGTRFDAAPVKVREVTGALALRLAKSSDT